MIKELVGGAGKEGGVLTQILNEHPYTDIKLSVLQHLRSTLLSETTRELLTHLTTSTTTLSTLPFRLSEALARYEEATSGVPVSESLTKSDPFVKAVFSK